MTVLWECNPSLLNLLHFAFTVTSTVKEGGTQSKIKFWIQILPSENPHIRNFNNFHYQFRFWTLKVTFHPTVESSGTTLATVECLGKGPPVTLLECGTSGTLSLAYLPFVVLWPQPPYNPLPIKSKYKGCGSKKRHTGNTTPSAP